MNDTPARRKRLETLRQLLLDVEETGREAEQTVALDQTRLGRLSRMDAMQLQAMSVETGRRRRQKLQAIEHALRQLEEGNYGYCEICGDEIPEARLEADPTVQHCVPCAESIEASRP